MPPGDFRFDDLVRTERYFTATLFPAILLHADFTGLKEFLKRLSQLSPKDRDASGDVRNEPLPVPTSVDPDQVEIATEFHIWRDLQAADALPSLDPSAAAADPERPEQRPAPDAVIVVGNQLIVCEAKFFGPCNLDALNRQLKIQRHSIRFLFQARSDLVSYRHVVILPFRFNSGHVDCDASFTWKDIADLSEAVLTARHYVTRRLRAAVRRYEQLSQASGEAASATAFGGRVPLEDALAMCRKTPTLQIGFMGGMQQLRNQAPPYLLSRLWAWRDPAKHTGNVKARNWIPADRFLEFMQPMVAADGQRTAPPRVMADGQPTPQKARGWAEKQVSLAELRNICVNKNGTILVGFQGGLTALEAASRADIERKRSWKWRDPNVHTGRVHKANWISCEDFLKAVWPDS